MHKMMIGIAALLVSACGAETYQVAPADAFAGISSLGSDTLEPLPGGLNPVDVSFEASPADNAVQWKFTHDNDDIATIVAKVDPNGANASDVTIYYTEGNAPSGNWRNSEARALIKGQIRRLVVEAVDAKLEQRPMDTELKKDVYAQVAMSSIGSMMQDASAAMDEAAASWKEHDEKAEAARASLATAQAQAQVGKPMTDLGGKNR